MKITAYPVKQGDTVLYLSAIAAGNLTDEEYWRCDRWDPATQEGYQREINQSHAHRLARYLGKSYLTDDDNASGTHEHAPSQPPPSTSLTNVLPGSIVVNFRKPLKITKLEGGEGAVEITLQEWPGYIIDGQHRIEGIRENIDNGIDLVDYEFPVTITQFSQEEEMIHFRNLNSTANRPPKGLNESISYSLYTKYGRTPATYTEISNNRATGITMKIAADVNGPWFGKIALGGIRKRQMHTMVQSQFSASMSTLFRTGRFGNPKESQAHIYDILENYWLAVQAIWPEAVNNPDTSEIQRQSGVFPLHKVLEKILNQVKLDPSYEDFVTLLHNIRVNADMTGEGWMRDPGSIISQLKRGQALYKSHTSVAEFLWNAIDEKTKTEVRASS